MTEMRRDVVKSTPDRKGDWKPLVFFFTDGVPTDETTWRAPSCGGKPIGGPARTWSRSLWEEETDLALLHELTDNVFHFQKTTGEDYRKFFRWVTASIKSSSASVETSGSGFDLAKLDHSGLEIAPNVKRSPHFSNALHPSPSSQPAA